MREGKDRDLRPGCQAEDRQAERDRPNTRPRAQDRAIDETVRMPVTFVPVTFVVVMVVGMLIERADLPLDLVAVIALVVA